MTIFERLTSRSSTGRISYETYRRIMRAMKPKMLYNMIDAYWETLDKPDKEEGLNIKQFNELLFNLNFDLRQRTADQTLIQRTFPSIYHSKPSRVIIDFVNTGYVILRTKLMSIFCISAGSFGRLLIS